MKLKEKLNVSIKTFSTWVNIILATLILLGLISSALCNEQKVFRFNIEENSEEGSLASISTTFPPTPPSPSSKNVSIPMGVNGMSGIFPALTVSLALTRFLPPHYYESKISFNDSLIQEMLCVIEND